VCTPTLKIIASAMSVVGHSICGRSMRPRHPACRVGSTRRKPAAAAAAVPLVAAGGLAVGFWLVR